MPRGRQIGTWHSWGGSQGRGDLDIKDIVWPGYSHLPPEGEHLSPIGTALNTPSDALNTAAARNVQLALLANILSASLMTLSRWSSSTACRVTCAGDGEDSASHRPYRISVNSRAAEAMNFRVTPTPTPASKIDSCSNYNSDSDSRRFNEIPYHDIEVHYGDVFIWPQTIHCAFQGFSLQLCNKNNMRN